MDDAIPVLATVGAVILTIAAVVALLMQRPVVAGTFFIFTAIAIYLRETNM